MDRIIEIKDNVLELITLKNNQKTIIKLENINNQTLNILGEDYNQELIFEIGKNVTIDINHLSINSINKVFIRMNEKYSQVNYNNSTINNILNKGIIRADHFADKTTCNLLIHGLNKNGELFYDVVGKVEKDAFGCVTNQDSKIINLTNNPVGTTPILLIDNYDVVANHSGYIGGFSDEVLFYLKSRGINNDQAYKLLLKAFLLGNLSLDEKTYEKFLKIIESYEGDLSEA